MTPVQAADRKTGLAAVSDLSDQFAEALDYYKSAEFDETSCRQRFIDPFFAALGWDVADEEKRGPFADVTLEHSLRGASDPGGQGESAGSVGVRRPDYSFRINGDHKFFVEAKRPSVDIASPRPVFQVKSYGWSANTSIAILTDFEQLLVFDCRYRPVLDEPLTGLVPEFRLNFRDYIAHWDLLWDTFSREAVASGSLTRYMEQLKDRPGQLPVDKAFLADLARWRTALAKAFAAHNKDLDVWQLNEATQLTLDRLVFIRVCEDRRLEPEEVLRPLLETEDVYSAFIRSLEPLRTHYNGGLMDTSFADGLKIPDAIFARVIRGLYTPWSPYRFDVLGVEILGSIYERALASIVTLGDNRSVSIELKPEVRKAGGVYYTPQWVVDNIVRRTIDPLISGKAPKALRKFRVLDPACGSGSFLLGAYAHLIAHYEAYYTAHPSVERESHYADADGIRRLTADARAGVLQRHIFGVDVDPAAVEVTTMSLYLKSLESEAPEFVRTQMQISGAVLPSLASNIRTGNSLVGTDFYGQEQLADSLDDFEEHRLRPFKWESDDEGFGKVLKDGGFSVVIGNPPYFSIDAVYGAGHAVPAYLKRAYDDVWLDKGDIYYFFLRKAVELANDRLGFIVSRAFLAADRAQKLRGWLSNHARLLELTDFDGFMVFADASIATTIAVFDTSSGGKKATVDVARLRTGKLTPDEVVEGVRARSAPFEVFERRIALGTRAWHFPNPYEDALYKRIDSAGEDLGSLCDLGQGMQTGANSVFGISAAEIAEHDLPANLLKRRARNSEISSFYLAPSDHSLLYFEDVPSYRNLPKPVRTYLELPSNREKLESRAAYKRGNCDWWRYTWPLSKELYGRPRLVCPYRTGHLRFVLDDGFDWLSLTDTTVAFVKDDVEEDPRYLLALVNSKLLTFRFRGLAKLTGENMWEAFDNSIKHLPIRRIDFDDAEDRSRHDALVRLASDLEKSISQSHHGLAAADRSLGARRAEGFVDQLDEIVLDLYGITDPEERSSVLALGAPFG
jgi:Eco57I restriction-modification methylase/N-6 DNA Methylase